MGTLCSMPEPTQDTIDLYNMTTKLEQLEAKIKILETSAHQNILPLTDLNISAEGFCDAQALSLNKPTPTFLVEDLNLSTNMRFGKGNVTCLKDDYSCIHDKGSLRVATKVSECGDVSVTNKKIRDNSSVDIEGLCNIPNLTQSIEKMKSIITKSNEIKYVYQLVSHKIDNATGDSVMKNTIDKHIKTIEYNLGNFKCLRLYIAKDTRFTEIKKLYDEHFDILVDIIADLKNLQ